MKHALVLDDVLYRGNAGERQDERQRMEGLFVSPCFESFASPCSDGKAKDEKKMGRNDENGERPENARKNRKCEKYEKRQKNSQGNACNNVRKTIAFRKVATTDESDESEEQPGGKSEHDGRNERPIA
ncbi:MAG: hypothetical protein LBF93_13535 [Zoogloeaceae bacterium]|nr:hypothetical protein [Zoogloeaceae bacterium]